MLQLNDDGIKALYIMKGRLNVIQNLTQITSNDITKHTIAIDIVLFLEGAYVFSIYYAYVIHTSTRTPIIVITHGIRDAVNTTILCMNWELLEKH